MRYKHYKGVSQEGLDLIKEFEGLKLEAYKCPAGVWTIGYGHTKGVKQGQTITVEQAEELLKEDLKDAQKWVSLAFSGLDISQHMYDACVSLAFNIGSDNFNRSTLKRFIVLGEYKSAANEFLRWNKARNAAGDLVALDGLTRRRRAEKRLFES